MLGQLFTVFNSPVGELSIAWNKQGITWLGLPERNSKEQKARMLNLGCVEGETDAKIAGIIARVVAHLEGELDNLQDIKIDYSGVTDFRRQVFEAARTILPGQKATYGDVADFIGSRKKSRAVGQALSTNRVAIIVPCHRIIAHGGKIGGFTATGGCGLKRRLLEIEGAV